MMTEKESQMFQNLQNTETGRILVEYLEKLTAKLCDIRQISEPTTEKIIGMSTAARIIEVDLIDKIKINNPQKENVDSYE